MVPDLIKPVPHHYQAGATICKTLIAEDFKGDIFEVRPLPLSETVPVQRCCLL
jgi:hypothetical protein